jgi:hypothetical protein
VVWALVIFVPLGLIDALLDPLSTATDDAGTLGLIRATVAAGAGVMVSLLGEVFYTAVVSATVVKPGGAEEFDFRETFRELRLGHLLAADVLYAVIVAIGFVFLIVPGLVMLTWFALVAPAVEIEGRTALDGLRRSRELVRRRFWLVFMVLVPLTFASDLLAELAFSGALSALGHSFLGDWLGSVLSEVLTAPVFALFVVVLFRELKREPEDPSFAYIDHMINNSYSSSTSR